MNYSSAKLSANTTLTITNFSNLDVNMTANMTTFPSGIRSTKIRDNFTGKMIALIPYTKNTHI